MIELPTVKRKAIATVPRTMIIFGQSKVGKTTKLTELDDCLIIDTEQGARYIDALVLEADSLQSFFDILKSVKETKKKDGKNPYKVIAIDTLDKVVEWYEKKITLSYNQTNPEAPVSNFGDIPWGGGHVMIRDKISNLLDAIKPLCDTLIIVAHRKKTIIGNESDLKVNANHLDYSGKLKNLLCAQTDAIGYVFRDKNKELCLSFATDDDIDGGTRVPKLAGKTIPFDWNLIF